jgi:hypothetical protein
MAYGLADIVTIGRDGVRVVAGWTEPVTIPSPGAGVASVGRKIPGETYERILCAHGKLVTSAVVANRNVTLDVVDGAGTTQYSVPVASTVVASSTVLPYGAVHGAVLMSAVGTSIFTIPDLLLPPGYTVQFNGSGFDVADQWSSLGFLVQRYPSNLVAVLQEGS